MTEKDPTLEAEANKLEELRNEFQEQSFYWHARNEPAMSALFGALYDESGSNPELGTLIEASIDARQQLNDDLSTSEIAGVWRVAFFNDQLELGCRPHTYTTPQKWIQPIREVVAIVNDPAPDLADSERAERMEMALKSDAVGTNPFSRANPDELLMQTLRARFPNGYRWLDVATGILTVPNQILKKDEYPMHLNSLYSLHAHGNGTKRWEESPELTTAARRLLAREHLVDWCLAVDLIDPYRSVMTQHRALAALRGSEQANDEFLRRHKALAVGVDPKLSYKSVDLTSRRETEELKEQLGDERFDLITMSTVQHQLSTSDRRAMDSNAGSLLAPGGLLLKKDFVHISPSRPHEMQFYTKWHRWGKYRGFVLDPIFPDMGWQELCRNGDSRCMDIAIGSGRVAIGKSFYSFEELVLREGDVSTSKKSFIDLGVPRPRKRSES